MSKKKEQKPWDITKSGPISYRDLQKQNAAMYEGIDAPTDKEYLYNRSRANAYKNRSLYNAAEAAPTRVQSPLYNTHTPLGQSAYDQSEYNIDEFNEAGYIRGENQPWIMQAINGTTKAAVLAGTTAAEGIIGGIWGLGSAIYHKDFDNFWDNDFSKTMKLINEASEEWMPNYYTKEEQENPWYTNIFTPNFIFDKVVKNIGFTIGAAYAGGVYAKAIGGIFKGLGAMRAWLGTGRSLKQSLELGKRAMDMSSAARHTKSLVGSIMSAVGEGTIEAVNNSDDYANAERKKYDALSAEDTSKAYDKFAMEGGVFDANGNPVLDNTPKSLQLQADLKKIADAKQAAYDAIEESRKRVGTWDLIANIPILTYGNWYTFGKMYAGGWKGAKRVSGIRTRATKEAMDAAKKEGKEAVERLENVVKKAKKTGYQGLTAEEKALVEETKSYTLGDKSYATLRALGEPLKEGLEEMNQSVAAKIPSNYYGSRIDAIYDAKMDRESTEQVVDWWKAITQGFKDIYGDVDNYEEGFIGALTGMFGSPTFGKTNNSTSETYIGRSKWIGMSGGVVPQWRNAIKDREHEREVVEHVNNILKSGNLERGVKHLIAQTFFDNKQRVAVIKDDKKEYKDSELASMFENIMYLREGGKLDLLERAIANMDGYTEEDAKKILETTKKEISIDGKNIEELVKRRDDLTAKYEEELEAYNKDKESTRQFEESMDASDPNQVAKLQQAKDLQAKRKEYLNSILDDIEKVSKEVKDSNSHTESGYLDEDGNLMSPEEVLADLNERKEKYKTIIDYVAKTVKDIDNATGEALSNEQLSTLVWYKTMMKDWRDRANSMGISLDRLISSIFNNPELKASLESLDDMLEGIDESKLTSLEQIVFGGHLKNRRILKNYLASTKSIVELFQKINEKSEDAGLYLARALNDDTEITVGEGENAKKVKNGDYIFNALVDIIGANKTFTEDEKMSFTKNLTDLKRIGNDYNTYMRLLSEYTKNPGNIDKAHEESTNRATREANQNKRKKTTNSIRFDGKTGELAVDLKKQKDSLEEIGFDEWKESLSDEERAKVDKAEKLIDAVDSLDEMVDGQIDDKTLNEIAHAMINDGIELSDDINELLRHVEAKEDAETLRKVIEASLSDPENDFGNVEEVERLEAQYRKFWDDHIDEALRYLDAKEKASEGDQSKEVEEMEASRTKEDDLSEGPNDENDEGVDNGIDKSGHKKRGQTLANGRRAHNGNGKKSSDTTVEKTPSTVEQDKAAVKNQAKRETINKKRNRRLEERKKRNYTTAYSNRPQISEYFMFGNDLQTYLQYITEHPDKIPKAPKGTSQEEFNKAYIQYIKAVHQYLKDNGSFDYVKSKLKAGQELIFTVDDELSKNAGVPIVVIKAKTDNGDYTIVGTMKSKLDFDSINSRTKKSYGETDTEQKKLYEEVLEKYKEYKANSKSKTNQKTFETNYQYDKEMSFYGGQIHGTLDRVENGTAIYVDSKGNPVILLAGKSDHQFIGIFREPNSNKWSIKMENKEGDKSIFKNMLSSVMAQLPLGAELYERTSISVDGLRIFSQQLKHGFEIGNDTYETDINGADLANVFNMSKEDQENMSKIEISEKELPKIKEILRPYLEKFGVKNIDKVVYITNGKNVSVKLPILVKTSQEQTTSTNEGEFVGATTTVDKLMGGDIAFSAVNEHSVSDIFENTGSPIIFGVVDSSGTIDTGNTEYNDRILQVDISSAKPGQVYLLIPSNNGSLVPALCYGTNLEDLMNNDNDWYINDLIRIIQSLTQPTKIGSLKNELAKALGYSTQTIHINYGYNDGGSFKSTNDLNEADRVRISAVNRAGKTVTRIIALNENKEITREKAKIFINSLIEDSSTEGHTLTVNLDTNKRNNKEYLNNIAQYYYTNVVKGETHTINDWFTYNSPNKINKVRKPVTPSPKETTPTGAPKSTVTKVVDGVTYTIRDGDVYDENDNRLSKEEADKVLGKTEERKPKEEKKPEEKPEETKKVTEKEEEKPRERRTGRKRKGRESVSLLNIPKEEEEEKSDEEQSDVQEEPKEEPKEKEEEKKEEDKNDDEGTPTSTSELGEDRAKTTRANQRNNRRRRPRASSEEATETRAEEPKETTKKTLRERTIAKSIQIFPDANQDRIKNIVNKIFDSVENNKGAMGLIKDISNVIKFLKRLYDPVAGFTVRNYNNFIESVFTPSEIEEIDAAAIDEYGLSNDFSLRTVQKVEAIMTSLKEYMDGYSRVKSKKLLNAFKVIKNIVDTVGKNTILLNNFLNRTMIDAGFITDTRSPQDRAIESSLRIKYAFKNLSKELKDILSARGISEQVYSALSPYQQMAYLKC